MAGAAMLVSDLRARCTCGYPEGCIDCEPVAMPPVRDRTPMTPHELAAIRQRVALELAQARGELQHEGPRLPVGRKGLGEYQNRPHRPQGGRYLRRGGRPYER